MISDKLATFADGTALNTGAAGSYIIGDQIDTRVAANGIGAMVGLSALYLVILVKTAATSGGSATAAFNLVTDDNGSLSSPTVVVSTPALPVASLTAGKLVACIALPIAATWERYIGIQQVTGTAAFTGGTLTAFLTTTPPARAFYPQNSAISY